MSRAGWETGQDPVVGQRSSSERGDEEAWVLFYRNAPVDAVVLLNPAISSLDKKVLLSVQQVH